MIELNEKEKNTLTRLMAQGLSKGEALVKMGKATRRVEEVKPTKKVTTRKPREVDPVRAWLMGFIAVPLKGCTKGVTPYTIEDLVSDGSKSIDFTVNGESYSLTLTKHKKKA